MIITKLGQKWDEPLKQACFCFFHLEVAVKAKFWLCNVMSVCVVIKMIKKSIMLIIYYNTNALSYSLAKEGKKEILTIMPSHAGENLNLGKQFFNTCIAMHQICHTHPFYMIVLYIILLTLHTEQSKWQPHP